jgi:small subunit ribosomal protein S17
MTDEQTEQNDVEEEAPVEAEATADEVEAVAEAQEETPAEEEPEAEAAAVADEAPAEVTADIEPAGDDAAAEVEIAEAEAEAEAVPEEAVPEKAGPAEAAGEAPAAPVRKKKKRLPRALRRVRSKPKREKPAERKPISRLPKPESSRGRTQERQGTVVSAASDKTIVVRVDTVKVHPRYKKVIRRSTKLHAHDEQNEAKLGDVVLIVETRPLSRMKRWRLQRVVEAAK